MDRTVKGFIRGFTPRHKFLLFFGALLVCPILRLGLADLLLPSIMISLLKLVVLVVEPYLVTGSGPAPGSFLVLS